MTTISRGYENADEFKRLSSADKERNRTMTTTTPPAASEPLWSDNAIWMALVGMLKPNNMLDIFDTDSVVRQMRDSYQAELDRLTQALAAAKADASFWERYGIAKNLDLVDVKAQLEIAKAGTWQPLGDFEFTPTDNASFAVYPTKIRSSNGGQTLTFVILDIEYEVDFKDKRLCRLVEVDAASVVPIDDIESVIVRYLFAIAPRGLPDDERLNRVRAWLDKVKPAETGSTASAKEQGGDDPTL